MHERKKRVVHHLEEGPGLPAAVEHARPRLEAILERNPKVRRFEVFSPRIDPAHDGATIAHLTDLHLKGRHSTRRLERAIRVLNEVGPDAVVLTGDYVRYSREALPHIARTLGSLAPRKIATLGNHDHWLDAPAVTEALRDGGCTVLSNEHATIDVRGAPLHVVGIDDRHTRHADPERAFSRVPERGTRVVLSHIPEVAEETGAFGGALVLSGHTHGGQVRVPGITARIFASLGKRYLAGFFRVDGQVLYVSRGIGASVPIRLAAPTEVSIFVLRSASA